MCHYCRGLLEWIFETLFLQIVNDIRLRGIVPILQIIAYGLVCSQAIIEGLPEVLQPPWISIATIVMPKTHTLKICLTLYIHLVLSHSGCTWGALLGKVSGPFSLLFGICSTQVASERCVRFQAHYTWAGPSHHYCT